MITPAFDLSQEPDFLILNVRVPYTRTSEFDLYIDGTDFKFYAKPYFLRWIIISRTTSGLTAVTFRDYMYVCVFSFRLSLPGRIVEDGREKAKFDIDKGKSHYFNLLH